MIDFEDLYRTKVEPKLDRIGEWAKNGYPFGVIAILLGIKTEELRKLMKDYDELRLVVENYRYEGVMEVRRCLYKIALGYDYEDTVTVVKTEDGAESTTVTTTKKHVKPNLDAIKTYLRLYDSEYHDYDNDTRRYRRQELEIKKSNADCKSNQW